jgi:ATP-dependent Clp protease ATP-binding subunit ClpA
MQQRIMNPLSKEILAGNIKNDAVIMLELDDVEIKFVNLKTEKLEV